MAADHWTGCEKCAKVPRKFEKAHARTHNEAQHRNLQTARTQQSVFHAFSSNKGYPKVDRSYLKARLLSVVQLIAGMIVEQDAIEV